MTKNKLAYLKIKADPVRYKRKLERNYRSKRKNPWKYWASKTIYQHKKDGYAVGLTTNELAEIASNTKTCGYCDCLLCWTNTKTRPNSPTWDRLDNGDTMTLENTLIVCSKCNSEKRARSHKQYIQDSYALALKFVEPPLFLAMDDITCTDAVRWAKAPTVLEEYAKYIDKHGSLLDAGLSTYLRYVAKLLRQKQEN